MLVISIICLILSISVNSRRDYSILLSKISIIILVYTIYLNYNNINMLYEIELFNSLLKITNKVLYFATFIIILTTIIIFNNCFYPFYRYTLKFIDNKININNDNEYKINNFKENEYKVNTINNDDEYKVNKKNEQYKILEYPIIILFSIIGSILLMFSNDIVTIFLSIELQSYGLYLLSALFRNSESSINAALTYFLLGSLSSCIILLGLSLLYLYTGTTNLENIYIINNIYGVIKDIPEFLNNNSLMLCKYIYIHYIYIQISFIILSIGLLFKISSAPFHFWSPDVYDALPTIITTFVAIVPKISLLIFISMFLNYTDFTFFDFNLSWNYSIIISSILSLIIGSILGLTQNRVKRLYAYSTISHIGFMLLALSINSLDSTRALIFYILQYSLSNLNAFILLLAMGYIYIDIKNKNIKISKNISDFINNNYKKGINIKDINYSPIQLITQLKGFIYINPLITISLIITLFSFVGIPPLIGFFGKQLIIISALDKGFIFATFVSIITSVISAVYYLFIIEILCFHNNPFSINKYNISVISNPLSLIISLLTLFILLFIAYDEELLKIVYIISI